MHESSVVFVKENIGVPNAGLGLFADNFKHIILDQPFGNLDEKTFFFSFKFVSPA